MRYLGIEKKKKTKTKTKTQKKKKKKKQKKKKKNKTKTKKQNKTLCHILTYRHAKCFIKKMKCKGTFKKISFCFSFPYVS